MSVLHNEHGDAFIEPVRHDDGCPACKHGTALDTNVIADCGHGGSPTSFHWIKGRMYCASCTALRLR